MSESTASPPDRAAWQCVLICWGTKYPVSLINRLVRAIADQSATVARFTLITDRDREGLDPRVNPVPMPAFFAQPALMRAGCQAKLCMFEPGVLPTDLPAIYIDLDSLVFGDLGRALALMTSPQTVAMLPSAIIPFGPIGRFIHRRTEGRKYARGNSSVVVFHPAHNHFIAARFRALFETHPDLGYRPMAADERFISWAAQPHMRAISDRFAVKLTLEYMSRLRWWLWLKPWMPWIRARRRHQVVVTLNGIDIKPENLLRLQDGDVVTDNKGRALIWSSGTLGPMQERIRDFYRGVV